jgi:hypothetical protein
MSAVDQAYRYAINLPCDWIIVTSMRETRLSHKGSQQHAYERFDTVRLGRSCAAETLRLLSAPSESSRPATVISTAPRLRNVGRRLQPVLLLYSDIRQRVLTGCARKPAAPTKSSATQSSTAPFSAL